jgi:hypothetical protein
MIVHHQYGKPPSSAAPSPRLSALVTEDMGSLVARARFSNRNIPELEFLEVSQKQGDANF